ncbi:glycosyltransferase [Geminocystis sp. NIES-3709]|uniref:glycosyltransferase n=1 Tax=Geminocystis sp. NIES-3709 TaxID=1617448 RepID=UPI0005FC732F|nr:glycosyltransferase [Geminocystis sp. NIES-3709]BAQ65148.1 glycosyl transferase [Geminocystis sp. NIES-3709]
MNKITVSVIIVVQNGEKYLTRAIESVLNQTYQPDEIIVVDGDSTDKTPDIAKSYRNIRYVQQTETGLANARNTGINVAGGDLIAFLDHDDRWCENKLSIQVNDFIKNPEIQYSYGRVQLFLDLGCELRQGFRKKLLQEEQLGRTPGTLMARKSLFEDIGQFNTEFTIGCDVEWFTRAKDYQILYGFIPEVLLYKRIHDRNLSGNVETNRKELFKIVRQSLQRQRVKD